MGTSISELSRMYNMERCTTMWVKPSMPGLPLDGPMICQYLHRIRHAGLTVCFTGGWTLPSPLNEKAEVTINYEENLSKFFVVVNFSSYTPNLGGPDVSYASIARRAMNKLLASEVFTLRWRRQSDDKLISC